MWGLQHEPLHQLSILDLWEVCSKPMRLLLNHLGSLTTRLGLQAWVLVLLAPGLAQAPVSLLQLSGAY